MKKQKEFELMVRGLALAHRHFSLHQIIQSELTKELYTKHKFMWDTIQFGLEQSYLIGLARFFERPKNLDETISIYYFYDFGQNDLINKLKKARNNFIGHYDKKIIYSSFLDDLKIEKEEIEKLFKIGAKAIEDLKKDIGYKYWDHVITGFPLDEEILKKEFKELVQKINS